MKAKLLVYLSVCILLLPSILAVGDTFAIVQGSVETDSTIYFEVYAQEVYLFDSFEVVSRNNLYALSITIPYSYSTVTLIPVVNGSLLSKNYELNSGDTLRIDFDLSLSGLDINKVSSSLASSFEFQPEENKKEIEDISNGDFKPYEDKIHIAPIPAIFDGKRKDAVIEERIVLVQQENPSVLQTKSFVEKIDEFVLQPLVLLTLAVIGCFLIVLVVLKGRRSEYL